MRPTQERIPFRHVTDISKAFEHALDHIFFENSELAPLTRKYGGF